MTPLPPQGAIALPGRTREGWTIAVGLIAVTVIHLAYEAMTTSAAHEGGIFEGLHHAPVALYVVPAAYAGLAFGLRGGLLVGVAAMLLTVPNLVLWHRESYVWAGESLFMLVVVVLGAGLAIPAARERRHRRVAEQEVRRLALLNKVTMTVDASTNLEASVDAALDLITTALRLQGACLGLWSRARVEPILISCRGDGDEVRRRLERAVREEIRPEIGVGGATLSGGVIGVPLSGTSIAGALAVMPEHRSTMADRMQLLVTVATQLGISIENVFLHRQEQENIRSFLDLATRLQEEERTRIAREIHDESAQYLSLIARGLRNLSKRAEPDMVGGPLGIDELTSLSETALQGLREFARRLRPPTLDNLGLVPSLEWLASELEAGGDATTTVVVEGTPRRIDPETEVAFFRIAQEALRNVARHSDASSAAIRISFLPGSLRVEIADDGRGFSPPQRMLDLIEEGRLGLVGMRERARLVGGSLAVGSRPGQGTTVVVEVSLPFHASDEDAPVDDPPKPRQPGSPR